MMSEEEDDVAPLIAPQFSPEPISGGSPKMNAFYDDLENSRDRPDREASMDLGSLSTLPHGNHVETNGNLNASVSRSYTPPEVENLSDLPMGNYITCQICQTTISIKSLKARVVKCPRCQEGNPIKEPPPGKKYIRCACNCLLVCNAGARAVICPRQGCHHRTQLMAALPKPKMSGDTEEPTVMCPSCYFGIKISLARSQYFRCTRCNTLITSLTKSERSLLILRYFGFFVILALLLTTGILILELVPGKIWEPMLFCGIAFGVGFPCLIWRFLPLCKSQAFR